MTSHSDLTFITNENSQNLLERFKVLIKDTELFDVLVGYFYTSGFHALYESLETTKKIRILIGISTNKETANLIQKFQEKQQYRLQFSHAETKRYFSDLVAKEIECCKDEKPVEDGIIKFMEWLENGKLEIKAYQTKNLHAKLYIMSFPKDDRDKGRVITGSSNFSQSGLIDNLEFNVELKNPSDHDFAQDKFNKLWDEAVDVKEQYIETIKKRTWLNNDISPYELYLKFLYEYFKDDLNQADEILFQYVPEEFKRFEYQEQAVLNAKKILNEYGGVFLSDVVGLGKTYMSAMLAKQLQGRTLVIAPPILLDERNPGSWSNVFREFGILVDCYSIGKLDKVINKGTKIYENVFIDESHRFRTDKNITFEKIARICRGKKVVLVTATPLNNKPSDILSQISLFQSTKNSTIPNLPDLEDFFKSLDKKLSKLDKKGDHAQYISTAKENAHQIRESVLKYLIVRRTRTEIENYFAKDLAKQDLKFPEVANPEPLYYQFNSKENEVFNQTIKIVSTELKYARYKTLTYYTKSKELPSIAIQSQENLWVFMKIMLVKRLESSFYAFKKSIERFIFSYKEFIRTFDKGYVYISKKHSNKIIELIAEGNAEAIQKLLDEDKADKYPATDFRDDFRIDLENDLKTLQKLSSMWDDIDRDPKLNEFIEQVTNSMDFPVLKENKLIVFTESKETAEYLCKQLEDVPSNTKHKALLFTGSSDKSIRTTVIENFDAKAANRKYNYRILVATEVLSEGINLHRSNVVINYDIPWNPTRLMQRVGRVNRIDTEFEKIYTFNFFPTEQSNDVIKLEEIAKSKIHAFISLLGSDARHLTEGEAIESHELFSQLFSKEAIIGKEEQQESELKYLNFIKDIKNKEPDLFTKIEQLPKKARTAQKSKTIENGLLTYFRKGKLQKFYLTEKAEPKELDFMNAAKLLEAKSTTLREDIPKDFYDKLEKNKSSFSSTTSGKESERQAMGQNQNSSIKKLLRYLRITQNHLEQCSEEQKNYLKKVIQKVEAGSLPSQTITTTLKKIDTYVKGITGNPDSLKIISILRDNIADDLLGDHIAEKSASTKDPREVILSEYLIGN